MSARRPTKKTARGIKRPKSGRVDNTPDALAQAKAMFLEGVDDNYGCISDGLRRAGINRSKYDRWMKEDPEFAAQVREIRESFIDKLERSAMRRAIDGHKKAVTSMGEIVGEDTVYETNLTIFMLKSMRRESFGDKVAVQISPEAFALEVQKVLNDEDDSALKGLNTPPFEYKEDN